MATTHFGFESVPEDDKARRVRGVFDSVAPRYDLMNDLMSMGLHRAWKAYTVLVANLREGARVLDIAGGTGDLALAFAKKVGPTGQVVHTDINEAMLRTGPRPPAGRRRGGAHAGVRRRKAAVCRRSLRRRERGLWPAQHDAQGQPRWPR
jgi:SAM-dependent methyltransferase